MPFTTAIGSTSLIGFGISKISKYIGTLWYYSNTATAWTTLASWYRNEGHTVASSTIPTAANPVVLSSNATVDVDVWSSTASAPSSIAINGHVLNINGHALSPSPNPPGYTCAAPYVLDTDLIGDDNDVVNITGHITIPA